MSASATLARVIGHLRSCVVLVYLLQLGLSEIKMLWPVCSQTCCTALYDGFLPHICVQGDSCLGPVERPEQGSSAYLMQSNLQKAKTSRPRKHKWLTEEPTKKAAHGTSEHFRAFLLFSPQLPNLTSCLVTRQITQFPPKSLGILSVLTGTHCRTSLSSLLA